MTTVVAGATVFAMAFSSLFSMEVERVWLFMVPPVALVAGRHLYVLEARLGGRAVTYATLAVSAMQLLLAESLAGTFR